MKAYDSGRREVITTNESVLALLVACKGGALGSYSRENQVGPISIRFVNRMQDKIIT
jgi:hypothetical protein